MKLLNTVGLSLATLVISIATPLTVRYVPQSAPTLSIAQAVASAPLLQVQDRLGPHKQVVEFDEGNRFASAHHFNGTAGQMVSITLESNDFDTILMLINSKGERIASSDDISQTNTNSRIDITLPATDRYMLLVTSFEFEGQGDYRLAVVPQS
ncbi:PPC domain-containing protein [Nodosilinea sp. E11]|uniref:PPC domain-containing protein n=1 Tax=Nodosilinea sp. E11 TaxID=3037479 RepID=UPI00293521C8|nr:PPC domain-containing protein [Nodosilinea sp. E11]WOD39784.1 PPC domain-containing protein [Nodosilinea sp. E11]